MIGPTGHRPVTIMFLALCWLAQGAHDYKEDRQRYEPRFDRV